MTKRFPTPDYHFSYRIPPVSGNTINGLGETSPRRARQVFHGSGRSEEHTSELQSRTNLVCRLLLEKKNKNKQKKKTKQI